MDSPSSDSRMEGIAIIGMAGRFPGARNVDEMWRNLREGKETVTFFSDEELLSEGVEKQLLEDPKYVKAGGVLDDISLFDAEFFGYSPSEAELMDPQHRIFLECAWHALEDAGYDPAQFERPIGVFAGAGISTYLAKLYSDPELLRRVDLNQITLGNEKQYLTSRVAYRLNLRGPAITVQTACSTSLVAIHLAAQSLLAYECDMALAGGVLICAQKTGYLYIEGGILSPDGHNRSFDQNARGTVGGNGCGIVVLKRLEDAVREGDTIRAVIKGSAANNDGAVKPGFTAPGVDGQAEVIVRSQTLAGISAETISYMEAHGSATPLGDPVEIAASKKAFQFSTVKKQFCALGSIKSNLGHLGEAAGVAGLIKTVLALEHKLIPPSLHFTRPNPAIHFEDSPFFVNTALKPWQRNGTPLRAGVSSFGLGGTNTHVILEEAPAPEPSSEDATPQLVVLSARSKTALDLATRNLIGRLKDSPEISLGDVAFTLQVGRQPFRHRRFAVCRNKDHAISLLEDASFGYARLSEIAADACRTVFMFPGAGELYCGISRQLYRDVPFFTSTMDECLSVLRGLIDGDPRTILYPDGEESFSGQLLDRASLLQPTLFCLEYSLARLWMHWGIEPQAMIGYGVGEYVAACLADVFSLEDALTLVAGRAQAMKALPLDCLLAVSLSEKDVQPWLKEDVALAAIEAADLCVLAGHENAIRRIEQEIKDKTTKISHARINHLSYCRRAEAIRPALDSLLQKVKLRPPRRPYISSMTGTWINADHVASADYWVHHMGATTRFYDAVRTLQKAGSNLFLEVGPPSVLGKLVLRTAGEKQEGAPVVASTLRLSSERESDVEKLLSTAGTLWSAGARLNWSSLHTHGRRRRVPLPPYPMQRRRYWVERKWVEHTRNESSHQDDPTRPEIADWYYVPSWKRSLAARSDGIAGRGQLWLIFADEYGVGGELKSLFTASGNEVITIIKSDTFHAFPDGSYSICPGNSEDYDRLLSAVLSRRNRIDHIVHLWSLNADSPMGEHNFENIQTEGFYSLLYLTTALKSFHGLGKIKLQIVSDHLCGVTGMERICPEKATMVGLGMVAQQESSNLTFRYIDIALSRDAGSADPTSGRLLRELTLESEDFVIALRGSQRWVRSFEPIHLSDEKNAPESWLRTGGTYMLTGGLGGVGLMVADYLAQSLKAKLVLVGRSEIVPREQWYCLPRTCDADMARKIGKLRAMERGAEIMVARADVASFEQMESVLEQARERFGRIHGIFHLAGTAITKPLEETTAEDCSREFQAKVHGVYVLEKLVKRDQPDFCVLFSSNASILGGLGFAAYAAANCFMDAYASQANSQGGSTHWMSTNWDGWVLPEQRGDELGSTSTMARYVMQPEESIEALRRILISTREDQVIVSRENLDERLATWVRREQMSAEQEKPQTVAQRHPRPELQNEYVRPGNEIEEALVSIFQDLLGIESVGTSDDFFELGGDSLMAINLFAQIRLQLEVDLPIRTIFDASNAAHLGKIIAAMRNELGTVLKELESGTGVQ